MTTTKKQSLREAANSGDPGQLATVARKIKLGNMLSLVKATVVALAASAAVDLTAAATKAAATVTGITLATGEMLPAAFIIKSLRVTASGTAASVGAYMVGDTGATPTLPTGGASAGVGIAKLSDDGKTITFPNTVTAFVVEYLPRADAVPDTTEYQPTT